MGIVKLVAEIGAARSRADVLPEGPAYDAAMGLEDRLIKRLAKRVPQDAAELGEMARVALRYGPDDALNAAVIRNAAALAA